MKAIDPQQLQTLSAAVLSDVMDTLGLRQRAMKPFVRPLDDGLLLVGRARTGLYMPNYQLREGENPYEVEIALVDDLKPGEVVVLACNGPTDRIAPWGELLTTASMARGASGCVTDGLVRDVKQIRDMKFPVFHGGFGPLDTKGREIGYGRNAGETRYDYNHLLPEKMKNKGLHLVVDENHDRSCDPAIVPERAQTPLPVDRWLPPVP